jgi:hypothetical protein
MPSLHSRGLQHSVHLVCMPLLCTVQALGNAQVQVVDMHMTFAAAATRLLLTRPRQTWRRPCQP